MIRWLIDNSILVVLAIAQLVLLCFDLHWAVMAIPAWIVLALLGLCSVALWKAGRMEDDNIVRLAEAVKRYSDRAGVEVDDTGHPPGGYNSEVEDDD